MIRRQWKKPGPTARARARKRRVTTAAERSEKGKVRDRDVECRFPLCGCKRGVRPKNGHAWLTVSHDFHKGMGGDPNGKVSIAALMVLLCVWRHQEAPVSVHAQTVRTTYLTPDQNDGPVAWAVDLFYVYPGLYDKPGVWLEVGRETYIEGSTRFALEELTAHQEQVLADLAEMER